MGKTTVIKNGLIVDGTGNPGFLADVLIEGDRVTDAGQAAQLLEHMKAQRTRQVGRARPGAAGMVDLGHQGIQRQVTCPGERR
mgnify:CR=1 FL=1